MRNYLCKCMIALAISLIAVINARSQTFTSSGAITINNGANVAASPYPSIVNVSGLMGTVTKVTLTIKGFTNFSPEDVDMLLVGPTDQNLIFCSDAGGSISVNNLTITFDDAAAAALPASLILATGTFRPTNHDITEDVFPVPAPIGPYNNAPPFGSSGLSIFNGLDPNGAWKLYIIEDAGDAVIGSITSWTLNFTTTAPPNSSPFVTINQAAGQVDLANASPINFTVIFSEPVTGFTSSDVVLSGTAGATTVIVTEIAPNNGTIYNIAVGGMTIGGTVIASIPAGVVVNSNNIFYTASSSTDNTVTYSPPVSSNPTVTINQATGQSDPTSASPIHFTVTFSEAVTGFSSSDISFTGSTPLILITPVVTVTGGPVVYDVSVSGMISSGTVVATVPAGSAINAANQSNLVSTSTDNSVVYNIPSCTLTCPANITVPATSVSGAVVNYNVSPNGNCTNLVRIPAPTTTFPLGTTTVNAYNNVSSGAVYGLTGNNQLVTFNVNTADPTFISSTIPITGLQQDEKLAAIDFRPSNGQLYGIGVKQISILDVFSIKLYTINKTTGAATAVGTESFQLAGPEFSIDFNPVTDELRVLGNLGFNLRVNADLGTVIATDPRINYPGSSDFDPTIYGYVGAAHSNNIATANFTSLYLIHEKSNSLYIKGGINGIPSPNTGSATLVGPLGVNISSGFGFETSSIAGFDISLSAGALASFVVGGVYQLYSINLSTGAAVLIGNFSTSVIDIAIAPVTLPAPSCSFTVTVTPLTPPVITCPANFIVAITPSSCIANVSFTGDHAINITGSPSPNISYTSNTGIIGSGALTELTLQPGTTTITLTASNSAGTATCSFSVTVVDNIPPVFTYCPPDITVAAEASKCTADVGNPSLATDDCGPTMVTASTIFPVGISVQIFTATDVSGNTSTCSRKVTVTDSEPPKITCPVPITVTCASEIPAPDISAASASDNCGTPTITHVGDAITNQTCANKYTLTRTYKATDGFGNTAICTQLITVDDNTTPQIIGLTSSKQVLWPANHKMVDVTLDYRVSDNCVSSAGVTINIISNEPIDSTGDGDTNPDWEIIDNHHIRLRAERAANGTGRFYTITVTVSDGCNSPVSATTQVMVVHNITAPHSGNSFKVGSTVAFTGEFWDKPGNKHTAKWLIDGSTATGTVTEPSGNKNGKVTGSYKFTTPGVYKLQMNITDQNGVTSFANTNGDLEAIVVIYDPNGGYTYGGGWFDSPIGALVSNPSSSGKASYGFTMNYFKNSTNPKGETQFEFKVGDFEFNALNFDYLVISNSMAQFKGTGKIIGGQSGIGFTMTVTDGQLDGTGIDKIRMKIYNRNNGKVIYDNQPGASDAALPAHAVGANSIIVISGNNNLNLTKSNTSQQLEMDAAESKELGGLDLIAYPNPTASNFNITVAANVKTDKITMQVVDMYGRVIETRNVNANSVIRFGDRYKPGTYFVRVTQGKQHKEIKLVKLSD
jgi:hypothetical protein